MSKLLAYLTFALAVSTANAALAATVTTEFADTTKLGTAVAAAAGIIVDIKFATTTAKVITLTFVKANIDLNSLTTSDILVKYHATGTCASATTTDGTSAGKPEAAATTVVSGQTIVIPAATNNAVFTATSCIRVEIKAKAKVASMGCEAGTVAVSGSATHSTTADAGELAADTASTSNLIASATATTICKFCTDTKGKEIKAGITCFCGSTLQATGKSSICESTTSALKKCTQTKGTAGTAAVEDEYACATYAAASGTSAVHTTISAILLALASKRLLSAF